MRNCALVVSLLLALQAGIWAAPASYTLVKTIPVPGDGGWDYLTVDEAGRRVYLSHGNQVDVLDADTYELIGTIPDTTGVHGIALAPELGRGFTSNGRANTVTIFDLKDLKKLGEVKTGRNPDSIVFDPATKRVFAFNGGGKSATVIDAAEGKELGTIEVGGTPEFAVADGQGTIFVNVEDKNELLKIDSKEMKVLERWPLAPGATPTGLAFDPKSKRLFVGCRSKHMVVVNAENGKVVANSPIGERVDAAAFDPETGNIFFSCGDGTVSVFHADGDDKYSLVETIKTKFGSKTMALDRKTHQLFLPSAEFKAAEKQGARPTMVPKTFAVLVFARMEK
ncbi:MAG TPA: YncE family protein [Gemmataceae bacterium]|nr:YncE family protein [Gemmataceae bacterium]